jgi:glutamine amidotransferase
VTSHTFVAHVRWAYTGAFRPEHPALRGTMGPCSFHQGLVLELDRRRRAAWRRPALVRGDTDSERIFALIRREARARGGDWAAGITAAANWLADAVPRVRPEPHPRTATDLYALRYP